MGEVESHYEEFSFVGLVNTTVLLIAIWKGLNKSSGILF